MTQVRQVRQTYGDVLKSLKDRDKNLVARLPSWSNDVYISIQFPDENSKMTAPYLYVTSRYGRVPWNATMIEQLSDEWIIDENLIT